MSKIEYHLYVCDSEHYVTFEAPNEQQALDYAQQWMLKENHHKGSLQKVTKLGKYRLTMTIARLGPGNDEVCL